MPEINREYIASVGTEHRQNYGQFFTDLQIAGFMSRWVLDSGTGNLYDPAFGLGAFYVAAKFFQDDIHFTGAEVDPRILEFACANFPQLQSQSISRTDYLLSWGMTHAGIVCNPPYMRFQRFGNRAEVFAAFQKHLGIRLSGYTNTSSAFLLKSLSELSPGGRLAYIMPLEFLNTGYGAIIKEYLLRNGLLRFLVKLECEKDAFPDATTSVGILLAENREEVSPIHFYVIRHLSELETLFVKPPKYAVAPSELDPQEKWQKYFEDGDLSFTSPSLTRLGEYGNFSRGIATGANEFFAMSPSQARKLQLPDSVFVSCITKSSQIKGNFLENSDLARLKEQDAPICLLNVNGAKDNAVSNYIQFGEEKNLHKRYLTKARTPWYKLERRNPAPLLFGVFSREKFKVIRNLTPALHLTCYHGFYPNLFGQGIIDHLFLYFQSRAARQILRLSMRKYGDGLEKFEPNDLNSALVPNIEWLNQLDSLWIRTEIQFCKEHGCISEKLESRFDTLLNATAKTPVLDLQTAAI